MSKKILFKLEMDVLIEAESDREAFAIVSEFFERYASVKDRSQVKDPFIDGKWGIQIVFTEKLVESFRQSYEQATRENKAEFEWRDMPFVTAYAKYLLDYIDTTVKLEPKLVDPNHGGCC